MRGHEGAVLGVAFGPDGNRIVTASHDKTARIWNVARVHPTPRADLIQQSCKTTLANGLGQFSMQELHAAPVLDPQLDADACQPLSLWRRLGRLFSASLSP